MKTSLAILCVLAVPVDARADAKAEAVALFDQGIKDLDAGNTAAACKELAASLAKYPDSGTKGALAQCETVLGKVASAWQLWRDLADTAPAADLRADAATNAAQLERRLPHFILRVAPPAPAGLVVTVNGVAADPSLGVPLPVDPGPLAIVARASGRADWTATLDAQEGRTTAIDVPALQQPSSPSASPHATTLPPPPREQPSHRRVIGLGVAAAGVVAIAAGTYAGLRARSEWRDATGACNGSIDACPAPALPRALDAYHGAKRDALLSTVLVAGGAAAAIAGTLVWRSGRHHDEKAVRVAPQLGARSLGVALSARF